MVGFCRLPEKGGVVSKKEARIACPLVRLSRCITPTEGDVEGRDTRAAAELSEGIGHGVTEQHHQQRAKAHRGQGHAEEAPLLLRWL